MQVALQTAQNNASIQTPLRAEKLMTAHFNLAILTDDTASEKPANAKESKVAIVDPACLPRPQIRRRLVRLPINVRVTLPLPE